MTIDPKQLDPRTRWMWIFIALAILARIVFWMATERVWEDALITDRGHIEAMGKWVFADGFALTIDEDLSF